jgi:hypothetical protein
VVRQREGQIPIQGVKVTNELDMEQRPGEDGIVGAVFAVEDDGRHESGAWAAVGERPAGAKAGAKVERQ